ncbi:MAG: alpha/beta fold hydrolase [Ignavibacteria bacterium]|nr:alpha/beta fold hydrolase [Ignavibacteria bacterium]
MGDNIASQKEGGLGAAAWSLEQGFEVVMFDQRGHGRSSGSTCSYGYRESMDLLTIMRSLKPLPENRPVILWGNSMGAVTAILAADLDGRSDHRIVDLVIEESGYSDVWSLTDDPREIENRVSYPVRWHVGFRPELRDLRH